MSMQNTARRHFVTLDDDDQGAISPEGGGRHVEGTLPAREFRCQWREGRRGGGEGEEEEEEEEKEEAEGATSAHDQTALTLRTASERRVLVDDTRLIGSGRYSRVYHGRIPAHDGKEITNVAVKIPHNDEESQAEMENEIAILKDLDPDSSIIRVFDVCTTPLQRKALVLELATSTLADVIFAERPSFDVRRLIGWTIKLFKVVQHLVTHGVVHLDIKPDNILCLQDDLKLADFGNALRIPSARTPRAGTVAYTPPELLSSRPPSLDASSMASCQVYSAAATAYAMLTGREPFSRVEDYGIRLIMAAKQGFFVGDHNPWPTDRAIPAELKSLIERCTQRDPRLRPRPDQVLQDLDRLLNSL